ncbi:RHOMBOID-like protein 10, chloroplastic isoform X2 [Phalaenopsis equestris]|uniref:RHOMBOID-like protein 10, chloroplastic isoform X2 n=1 Tax=Phalaenopsis equestris TaxID=78828 RepID=UPI0009E4C55B|nr:RHOMBOID-like protein 10, chloroplastic isoform X2 [Phalaenopsis equestris]
MALCPRFPASIPGEGFDPAHLITVASALRLGHLVRLRCTKHLHLLLRSSLCQDYNHLTELHKIKDSWCRRPHIFNHYYLLEALYDTFSSSCSSCFSFFSGSESGKRYVDTHKFQLKASTGSPFNKRLWTNILLAFNILVYIGQIATQGKLLLWGAKVNTLIDKGQLWRLLTSSFLHANIGHLMVGSFSVFVLRHRSIFGGGKDELQQIAHVIGINMVIGLLSRGIDNWGHLGGFLGGAAVSWFLGPAWRRESRFGDGRFIYSDIAPITRFIGGRKMQ